MAKKKRRPRPAAPAAQPPLVFDATLGARGAVIKGKSPLSQAQAEAQRRAGTDFGVNRISMGVQSFDEQLLDRLGRIHSREMVFRSFDLLRAGGFDNVNLDLMFAIPGQSMDVWRATLDEAIDLGPEHLSCYEVIYEEDTPLYEQLKAGQFEVDEALACAMYDVLIDSRPLVPSLRLSSRFSHIIGPSVMP